ncbi:C-type lectin domain family 12 member A isoform X1 [Neofelis nebulosa]|uniref:C-type lectin domain family 12 member A isoform X1 n=1 Tax=Neofelis nebulosa TaxID=61452 RepID=UPI00272B0480|nr:C-type lectin domain family 12 member A isoform X1 [Neofelis nebulosa]
MSEEVTYADLNFQDSGRKKSIQEFGTVGIKEPAATSHVWHQRALALILLCLLLLIGLGILGSVFYITLKKEVRKLNTLQNIKEELQRNVSLQLMHSMNSSQMIRNLSLTLQEIATKLCHELYQREPEHKCKPCPKKWIWHEDNCYLVTKNYVTWQKNAMFCSAQNASLLMIKNKSVLEFVKSRNLRKYWLGLSPRKYYADYKIVDETIFSSDWFVRNTKDVDDTMFCGYINTIYVSYTLCSDSNNIICEKLANPVKIENTLMSEIPDEKYD